MDSWRTLERKSTSHQEHNGRFLLLFLEPLPNEQLLSVGGLPFYVTFNPQIIFWDDMQ